MNRVAIIEKEVQELSRDELANFRNWFVKYDSVEWDHQIESDINTGKLDMLAAKAVAAHKRGESRQL